MFYYDYHVHSHFSADSAADMRDMVLAAKQKGLTELCFCDHTDIGYTDPSIAFHFDVAAQQQEIEETNSRFGHEVLVKKGLELGLQPEVLPDCRQLMSENQFDFVIASIHTCDQKDIHTGPFFTGKTPDTAYRQYYAEMLTCLERFKDYDVLGHLDILKRYTCFMPVAAEAVYGELLEAVLKRVIADGKGIEVNTSGFRHGIGETYPNFMILKLYRQLGGEIITTGSDAHIPQQLAYHFPAVYTALKENSCPYICTFSGRKPTYHKIK